MAGSEERYSGAMESLVLLADSMQQASALLADAEDDGDEATQPASFLNVVALGSVVSCFSITFLCTIHAIAPHSHNELLCLQGAGKSAVLNSLMGYPVFVCLLITPASKLLLNEFLVSQLIYEK